MGGGGRQKAYILVQGRGGGSKTRGFGAYILYGWPQCQESTDLFNDDKGTQDGLRD